MTTPLSPIQTELGEPILFRTTGKQVYESTLATGSIWLRSDTYYRDLEDKVRNDASEGANPGTTSVPLRIAPPNGPEFNIQGPGHVGQLMVPHYLVSLHGSSIAPSEREAFGGYTFGIRSLSRLSAESSASSCVACSRCSALASTPSSCAYDGQFEVRSAGAADFPGSPSVTR